MLPKCKLAKQLQAAFRQSVPPIRPGDPNPFCTEDDVKIAASALTELVYCPAATTCDICTFSTYYKEKCIQLKCPHRAYTAGCISCYYRHEIAIFCDPQAFVKAHANPNPQKWSDGFPPVYTMSAEVSPKDIYSGKYRNIITRRPTTPTEKRTRYTTPRHNAQDMRRSDWSKDQKAALLAAYHCLGQHLGAPKPKTDEGLEVKELTHQKNAQTQKKPTPQENTKPTETETGETPSQIKSSSTQQVTTHHVTCPPAPTTSQNTKKDTDDNDLRELVQQVLETQEQQVQADAPIGAPRTNIIKLCLCTDPDCQAKQRPSKIKPDQVESQKPPVISQVHTDTKLKSIQINYDSSIPVVWEAAAAYIDCTAYTTPIKALIDTGSVISILSYDKAQQIAAQPEWQDQGGIWDLSVDIKAYGCSNARLNLIGRITIPKFELQKNRPLSHKVPFSFWVLHGSSEQCIISGEWLDTMEATLSLPHRLLYYTMPKEALSAGGDQYVMTKEDTQIAEPQPPKPPDITAITTQSSATPAEQDKIYITKRIMNHLEQKQPILPAYGQYSVTLGPAPITDKTIATPMLIDGFPARLVYKQNRIFLHIANTTPHTRQLKGTTTISHTPQLPTAKAGADYKASNLNEISVHNGEQVLLINTHHSKPNFMLSINMHHERGYLPKAVLANKTTPNVPEYAQLNNEEYQKTTDYIDTANQREAGPATSLNQQIPSRLHQTLEGLQKMQAKFDFKEHMDTKLLPIDDTKITFAEYPAMGQLPFHDKTDKLTIFLCYLLLSIGHALDLQNLTTSQIDITLQNFQEKTIQAVKRQVDKAFQSHNINKLYQKMPLQICYRLHLDLTTAFDNIHRIEQTQTATRNKNMAKKAIYGRLMIKSQALSTLMYYVISLIKDLATKYGQHPFFYHKTITLPTFKEIPVELKHMPPRLLQQILETPTSQPAVRNTRIKNKAEFQEFIMPLATPYQDREYGFKEFKEETIEAYDKLNRAAQLQAKPPIQTDVHKALTIDQLQDPKDVDDYLRYATSPSALYTFMKKQLPPTTDDVIPLDTFLNSLTQAKLVIYENPEQAIRDYIPHQLRPQFDQFFQMFKDPHFINTSKQLRLPDYPQMHVWGTKDEPSPLHDLDSGLVRPSHLAFCATQMLDTDDVLLEAEFETELALLASIIFVYGNFVVSLHQSHIGLFREDVFQAKTLLNPNTALQNAKPPKGIGEIDDADLNDKVDFMLRHGKAIRCHASPFLTSMTSIAKKRKASKPLEFAEDSPLLQYLLTLSQPHKEKLADQSKAIVTARKKLAQHLQTMGACPDKEGPKVQNIKTTRYPSLPHAHLWTQSVPIVRVQQKYLDPGRNRLNSVWHPPINHKDKQYILDQINGLSRNSKQKKTKIFQWGFVMIVHYDPVHEPLSHPTHNLSVHFPQYFKTKADYKLHRALENHQQAGSKSKHLVQQQDHNIKVEADRAGYYVKYAFPHLPIPDNTSRPFSPRTTRKQGLLTNFHAFHKLIEDTSTLALEGKVGPSHPNYDEIIGVTVRQISADRQQDLLKTKTLIDYNQNSHRSHYHLLAALTTIGRHAKATRQAANNSYSHNSDTETTWQQCQKALSLTLGTALIHSTEGADKLATVGPGLNKFIRARQHLQAYKLRSKHQQIAKDLTQGIWPEKVENWSAVTIEESKNHFNGWDGLFTAIAQFYQYPIVVVRGDIIKKSQRTYFDIISVGVYKPTHYDSTSDVFGCIALCPTSHEVFAMRTPEPNFLKFLIQKAATNLNKGHDCYEFTIKQILQSQQEHHRHTAENKAQRYSQVEYQHIGAKVYWKRDPIRTIINTRYNNQLSRETNTTFQSQNEIKQALANSIFFSSFDISQFYDQIGACPISSMLNTVLYKGQELAPTTASMGSRNSCLFATAVVLALLHHITDQLLLQPCYLPKPIGDIPMIQQHRRMSAEESYGMIPATDMPACDLLMKVISREEQQSRQTAQKHILGFTEEQQRSLRSGNNHQLLHQVTLIDDFCLSTAQLPNSSSRKDQVKKQLNVHLLCLKQLFMSSIQCSRPASNSRKPFQPAKFKIEKTHLFKTSVKFLNYIYFDNFQIIDLEAFKGSTNLDSLPMTGEALSSRTSFFTYFISYIQNLRFLCKDLEEFATKHPNNQKLPWDDHPEKAQQYKDLVLASRALSGIAVLPNDLNKVHFIVLSSDACNKTMAYSVGICLRPDPHSPQDTQPKPTKLQCMKNYSSNLEENLLNLPIATKEVMSAAKALTLEEPLLKLLGNIPKYHTIDNSVLFGLLEQLQNSKQLANHFVAHPQFRDYVLRLHQLTTMYNITVLLVPSKLCLADVCTRSDEQTKKTKRPSCKLIQGKPSCKLCPGCQITCVNSISHKGCPYNIRNTTRLGTHGPQLLQYKDLEKHTVQNENKSITYTTASTQFDPRNYKTFPIDQLVKVLQPTPWKSLDQTQTESIERSTNEDIQRLSQILESDVIEELNQLEEAVRIMPISASTQREIKSMLVHEERPFKKNHSANVQTNQPGPKLYHRTMPYKLYRINLYSKRRWQPTKNDSRDTTVILFTSLRKSLRIANSIYAQNLVGTATEKLERRVNAVTYTENPEGLNYLISCSPQDKLGKSNHSANSEKFLPQLHITIQEAVKKSPNKKIILDGNSVQKHYNLSAETIMTGLVLITRPYRKAFQDIGLVMWYRRSSESQTKNENISDPLRLALPIYLKGNRQGTLTVTLNNQGQCPDLPKLVQTTIWAVRITHIEIEYDAKTRISFRHQLDIARARAIHIVRTASYVRTTDTEINQASQIDTPPQFTSQPEQTTEPVLDALLAKRKLTIAQANDPFLIPMLQPLREASQQQKILQSECGTVQLKLVDGVVYGKQADNHNKNSWKPVLAEGMILSELMASHEAQRCSSAQNTVQQLQRVFFHKKNITSHYDLYSLSQKVLPCPRCVIRRPAHRTGNKLYTQTKNIAMSLGGIPCATLAHDIVYITNPKNTEFTDKYLSVIVCYGCSYVHLKMINQITGYNIATHILDMIQLTGHIPHVLITDSATTELRGIVAQCIQSLNIIQIKTNQQILNKQKKTVIQHRHPRPQEAELDETDVTTDPEEFPSVLLEDLTEDQRNMLLQDFVDSAPPLFPPLLTHNPVPYIDKHAYRTTSLGRLDSICGEIGIFLRKFITTQPLQLEDENIDHLIQSFAFFHNFLHDDVRTKQKPAKVHLGALRFYNTHSLLTRLQSADDSQNGLKPITKLQNMLEIAHEYKRAQDNRLDHERRQQRNHLNQHGRQLSEKKLEEMFPVLSIVMLHNEIDRTKTSKYPTLHGPHLVVAHIPSKRTIYILSLVEGHIYKRNYKAIEKLLPSQEIFSTPHITDWFQYHPLQLISKLSTSETMDPQLTADQYTKVLQNLTKVYELLKPVLPTAEETQKTIMIDPVPTPEAPDQQPDEPVQPVDNSSTARRTVKFRAAEPLDIIQDIAQPAHQHQQQPGIDVHPAPAPPPPAPPPIEPTRSPTRPKRTRLVPARYRQ